MTYVRPERLHPGDVIGICAPASPPASESDLEKGIRYLERLGFRVEIGRHARRRHGYLAGRDIERASDLNALFADRRVKAIFVARGGYGSSRILPILDYHSIRRNPKILVGYSDVTALHFALLSMTGLISFSGPMVAAELASGISGAREESFWRTLMSARPQPPLTGDGLIGSRRPPHPPHSGRLLAGNLSLVAALVGTPFFPDVLHPLLLLEEVGEEPYRVDRLLQQVKQSGCTGRAVGIATGRFIRCNPERGKSSLSLRQILLETFSSPGLPIITGIPYGHTRNSIAFPIGVRVRMNVAARSIQFLEAGVS